MNYINGNLKSYGGNKLNYNQHHVQSYQSLSSMAITGMNDTMSSTMSTIMMLKPLNRNSRRASMSELGYGKIESYNKLEKLGEVRTVSYIFFFYF
jgi:hypothetical protein